MKDEKRCVGDGTVGDEEVKNNPGGRGNGN